MTKEEPNPEAPELPDDAPDSPSRERRGWVGRHRLLAALLAALGAAVLFTGVLWVTTPGVSGMRTGWPDTTAYMRLRVRQARDAGRPFRLRYEPVLLSRIPHNLRRAVLVSEDAAFYQHSGFDWFEIRRAATRAIEEGEEPRGASTITQQLARNLYLSPRRTLLRKLREAILTWKLEHTLGKRRILELYLNVIELGPGIFGVQAASHHYFGIPVWDLTDRQAAEIAATIPSPRRANPATDARSFRWRTRLAYRRAFGGDEDTTATAADTGRLADSIVLGDTGKVARLAGDSGTGAPARVDTGDTTAVPLPSSGLIDSLAGPTPGDPRREER